MSNSLKSHGLQHSRLPCPSPTPRACSNSCPLSQWCYGTISSSVVLFSSHLQSFPASESFPVSQFFTSGSQNIGVSASASVLLMNIQDWFPLGLTGWARIPSKKWSSHHSKQISLKCSTWMQSQKWQNDLCLCPRQTIQYHSNPSLCPDQ